MNSILRPLKQKFKLDGHLDSVWGIHFISSISTLVSVSDDCTVKLWDLKM